MKPRSSIVLIENGHILLMYRKKKKSEYYVIPGGGIEEGETSEEAGIREFMEETGIEVEITGILYEEIVTRRRVYYYLAKGDMKEPVLTGDELERMSDENVYRPEWIPLVEVENLTLYPTQVKRLILKLLD